MSGPRNYRICRVNSPKAKKRRRRRRRGCCSASVSMYAAEGKGRGANSRLPLPPASLPPKIMLPFRQKTNSARDFSFFFPLPSSRPFSQGRMVLRGWGLKKGREVKNVSVLIIAAFSPFFFFFFLLWMLVRQMKSGAGCKA